MSIKAWISIQLFIFFATWSVFLSYWGLWLDGRGFDAIAIGSVITAGLVSRAVAVAIVFPFLNRHLSLLRIARILPWVVLAAAQLYVPHTGFAALLAVSVFFGLMYPIMMPLLETLTTLAAKEKLLRYGPTRAVGSVGFIVGTIGCGLLIRSFGTDVLIFLFIAGCFLMAASGLLPLEQGVVGSQRSPGLRNSSLLLRDRSFLLCIGIVVLIQGSHGAYYAFGTVRLASLGAGEWLISAAIIVAVASEIVFFKVAGARLERVPLPILFGFGLTAALVRWVALGGTDSVLVFTLTQLLHGGSFAITHLAFALYLRNQVRHSLAAPAQGLYAALTLGLGTAVFTALAGPVYEISPQLAFLLMGVACVGAVPLLRPFSRSLSTLTHPS